jgi:hypothetical protein
MQQTISSRSIKDKRVLMTMSACARQGVSIRTRIRLGLYTLQMLTELQNQLFISSMQVVAPLRNVIRYTLRHVILCTSGRVWFVLVL